MDTVRGLFRFMRQIGMYEREREREKRSSAVVFLRHLFLFVPKHGKKQGCDCTLSLSRISFARCKVREHVSSLPFQLCVTRFDAVSQK